MKYKDGYESWSPAKPFEESYRCCDTFLDRLEIEQSELSDKLEKLRAFIESPKFTDIVKDEYQRALLFELKYWNLFSIPIVNKAPEWDGHTTFDVMNRLLGFVQNPSNFIDEVITPWKAIEMINNFHVMRRSAWDKGLVVFRQVPANIQSDIIPDMQSVPKEAKGIIMNSANHIEYKNQLLMYDMNTGEANSWNPTASDLMTCDWESFVRF